MWHAWLIEQSLDDQSLFRKFKTVKMKSEAEDWKEHIVEIPEDKVPEAVEFLKLHLKAKWYAHMIEGNRITVIFRGMIFGGKEGDDFSEIEEYGIAHGVPKEQMEVSPLFDLARRSGF